MREAMAQERRSRHTQVSCLSADRKKSRRQPQGSLRLFSQKRWDATGQLPTARSSRSFFSGILRILSKGISLKE